MSQPIIIGAQYYRPPNPPKEDWARDLQRMKASGMNTVKLWACWSWMNPRRGVYDYADLDALMDIAAGVGLRVVINVILEDAPYWLERAHPEARYCDAEGRCIHLGAAMNTPGGGWPGLCFDNPPVRDAGMAFLVAVVSRYRAHPATLSWDVWNEPHLEPASYFPERLYCYCPASAARFRRWLKSRHVTLEALNAAWARRFSDWAEVEPPRLFEAVPDMLDWRAYWFATLRGWLDDRVATARAAEAPQPVMTHVALSGFTGQLASHTLDEWTLASAVDGFGTSSFPTWLMNDDPVEHLFNLDTARAAAEGKPFWQTELQGGRGRRDGTKSTRHPRPSVVALEMWNAIAAGAGGILFWQWRPELLGPESPGYGLCAMDGALTGRVEAASSFAALLGRLPELQAATPVAGTTGLIVSRRTALHAYATDRTMDIYRRSVMGAYRLLVDADLPVEVLHEDTIESSGVPAHISAIYHPMPTVMSDALAEALTAWVANGGRLVSEAAPGEYDERGWHRASVPPQPLHAALGIASVETDAIAGAISVRLDRSEIRAAWMREEVRLEGASAIGHFEDGAVAVTRNMHGAGEAVLIATCPSVAYDESRDGATRRAIARLFTPLAPRVVRVASPAPGLMTRRHRLADGRSATFVLNWTDREQRIVAERSLDFHVIGGSKALAAGTSAIVPALAGAVAIG
jgi:beta-galactosidase